MRKKLIEFIDVEKNFYNNEGTLFKKNKKKIWGFAHKLNFSIYESSSLAIVGSNGSGKSTILGLMNQILFPEKGEILLHEKPAGFLELGSGFNPEISGKDNIFLYGSILGLRIKEIEKRFKKIIEFSELKDYINYPVKKYSAGMQARLAFSVLIYTTRKLILIDEVLAVGDLHFQKKCINFLNNFKKKGGTLIIVHHTLNLLTQTCDEGLYLNNGKIIFRGNLRKALNMYKSNPEYY